MTWKTYNLDRAAQQLVILAKTLDPKSLNQSYKMRVAVTFGLERFWGEHLRLMKQEPTKSRYWKSTWDALADILQDSGLEIPNDSVDPDDMQSIQLMSEKLWQLSLEDQRIALSVLTQLCECLVWWTQRYK